MALASSTEDPRFRRLLNNVIWDLNSEEVKALSLTYLGYPTEKATDLTWALIQGQIIKDCTKDLNGLMESLEGIKRTDLKEIVMEYIKSSQPNQFANDHVSSTHLGTEESNGDMKKSTIHGGIENLKRPNIGDREGTNGAKKRRVMETTDEEKRDLEEVANNAKLISVCDSTSDDQERPGPDGAELGEITDDDIKSMDKAKEAAMQSYDQQTKVGAVIVDPQTRDVVGTGCNRMPRGCEDRFNWTRDKDSEPLECGKHYYVVYAVRAAILDAHQKRTNLTGCVLYTTLYPSNVCAQCIRDVGIAEVFYISDKFHDTKFMEASRKIMEGVKCRQMQ